MSEGSLLLIHALTSLHPGTGTALGVVDLPVQRERHTGWPVIPGSSLKGVLRDECRQNIAAKDHGGDVKKANEEDLELTIVFGPAKVEEDTSHAGALVVTDARILAFPVRSLVGVFGWVTCPAVLARLGRDLGYLGEGAVVTAAKAWSTAIPNPAMSTAFCYRDCQLLVDGKNIVLEEFDFEARVDETAQRIADWVAALIPDPASQDRLAKNLVVLHDDDFTYFVTHCTEVVARVGLDYERKSVKNKALFYEELLPPETIFYSLLSSHPARQKRQDGKEAMSAAAVLDFLHTNLPPFVQIGGDETIGRGICGIAVAR